MGFNINNFPFLEKDIEAISIYELIAKIGNKVVEIEKSNTDIENLVNELNADFIELKNYVDEYLVDVEEIKAQIEVIQEQILGLNNKVESYNTNLINLINNNFNILKAYIDDQIGAVNNRIDNLEIGAISVYNPVYEDKEGWYRTVLQYAKNLSEYFNQAICTVIIENYDPEHPIQCIYFKNSYVTGKNIL